MPESEQQKQEELRLLEAAQNGDVEAFGQLYERYAARVFQFLYAHMDSRLDAEDLTEEIFIKVWGALPGYRRQGIPFAGYLFRAARNALIDHYRRSQRRPQPLSLGDRQIGDPQADPAERLPASQEQEALRAALGQLRRDYRTVLSLRYFGDLGPDEIAAAMGRSSGAVRVLQHRALAALRKLLTDIDRKI